MVSTMEALPKENTTVFLSPYHISPQTLCIKRVETGHKVAVEEMQVCIINTLVLRTLFSIAESLFSARSNQDREFAHK